MKAVITNRLKPLREYYAHSIGITEKEYKAFIRTYEPYLSKVLTFEFDFNIKEVHKNVINFVISIFKNTKLPYHWIKEVNYVVGDLVTINIVFLVEEEDKEMLDKIFEELERNKAQFEV